MKKIFALLAIVPVLFACSKGGGSNSEGELALPKWAAHAAKITVSNTTSQPTVTSGTGASAQAYSVGSIQFLRSGSYIITCTDPQHEEKKLTGTYEFVPAKASEEGTYVLSGDVSANVTVSGSGSSATITITVAGESQSAPATVEPTVVQEGSAKDEICRSWKISTMEINFPNKNIKKGFTANDFANGKNVSVVVKYLKEKEINISEQKFAGYDVKQIDLDPDVVIVKFTGRNDFVGDITQWSNEASSGATITYDLSKTGMSSELINTKASGKITVVGKTATIAIDVQSENQQIGNGTVKITLTAIE